MSENIIIPWEIFSRWTAQLTTVNMLVKDPVLPSILDEMLKYEADDL